MDLGESGAGVNGSLTRSLSDTINNNNLADWDLSMYKLLVCVFISVFSAVLG